MIMFPLNSLNGTILDFDFDEYEKLTQEEREEKYPFLWPKLNKAIENQKLLGRPDEHPLV